MALTKVTEDIRTLGVGEVAIGNISGSAAGAAGTFLKQDGTWSAVASGIEWQAVQTTGFTAVAEKGYPCNTTAGSFTATLPSSASVGDQIALLDYAGTFNTNAVTINPNGLKIKGATDNQDAITERESVTLTYVDATQGWVATSGVNTGSPAISAPYNLEYLVVAGGGGGGGYGGGGGAGGYRTNYGGTAITFTPGNTYTATVGGGGAGVTSDQTGRGTNGTDSSFSGTGITTITSAGGGGGGATIGSGVEPGLAGGSGGGGSATGATYGDGGAGNTPSTSPVQGYDGGQGYSDAATYTIGGGGGGSSIAGADTNSGSSTATAGGAGTSNSITGAAVTYSGGGGGGSDNPSYAGAAGGAGGGGAGCAGAPACTPTVGTVNSGGGGGGGRTNGGAGGSGVVIIRVLTSSYTGTITGSPTVITDAPYTVLKYTGTGTYVG